MNSNRGSNQYIPRGGNPYQYTQPTRNHNINFLETIHELIISYNENIRLHNQIIEDYNHNIFNILTVLQHIHANNNNNNNQSNTNTPRTSPVSNNSNRRTSNNVDLSALLYLLNIPNHTNYNSETRHILLTQEQINNSTIIVNYNNEQFTDTTCPISLDEFEVDEEICQIVGCGHYFKKNHIMRWFQNNHVCPVCRYNIIDNQRRPTPVSNNNNISTRSVSSETVPDEHLRSTFRNGLSIDSSRLSNDNEHITSPFNINRDSVTRLPINIQSQHNNDHITSPFRNHRDSISRLPVNIQFPTQPENDRIIESLNTSIRSHISENTTTEHISSPLRSRRNSNSRLPLNLRSMSENIINDSLNISGRTHMSDINNNNMVELSGFPFRNRNINSRLSANLLNNNDNVELNIENVSRIIGDIILEQIPNSISNVDQSNNLMFYF